MSGIFGVISKKDCVHDLFFGVDYHSHLGTKKGGLAVHGKNGFDRSIHNIANSPFRTKFESDVIAMHGNVGIGCISDDEPQPLLLNSHLGSYAIVTVGKVTNKDDLIDQAFKKGFTHFLEMTGGEVNQTELIASLINQKTSIVEGLKHVQEMVKGSISVLIMTEDGLYASRDRLGRTPLLIGKKEDGHCVTFESSAYLNLGYRFEKELGPAEIVYITADSISQCQEPGKEMKFCTFLWVYFGYPSSTYEGINVEQMRYRWGQELAKSDDFNADIVAGIPDSGIASAIGYSNESKTAFGRPFVKYTPTWPRSFMPILQTDRNLIAKMKLIPIEGLIKDKSLVLIDDSIVRGTQLGETAEFLYAQGAKEVHIRPTCPPMMFGCPYLNFSRSTSINDLITRRIIKKREGDVNAHIDEYIDPDSERYQGMIDDICKELNFTSLKYQRLDDLLKTTGKKCDHLCTYCWNGKE